VNTGRITAEGYGEDHPVADNSTEEGRAKNRRIDIRIVTQ
jgi:outer membrane protein OmpA-like peptidoglycan-associated protein